MSSRAFAKVCRIAVHALGGHGSTELSEGSRAVGLHKAPLPTILARTLADAGDLTTVRDEDRTQVPIWLWLESLGADNRARNGKGPSMNCSGPGAS